MINKVWTTLQVSILILLVILISACQPAVTPEPTPETVAMTEVVEPTTVEVIQVVTPSPTESEPRTLVVCLGGGPGALYPYGEEQDFSGVVSNAYSEGTWGAYDTNSFAYQPIILEKLPSLADGDARLAVVTVSEGDTVVDATGNVVQLDPAADPAIMLVPVGGGDPESYQGGDFQLEQLSATFTLLPDLLWSDGTPMTAADSVYAFTLLTDPDTPRSILAVNRTASYEAIDERTIIWTGLPGYLDSSYAINFFGPAPEHAWGEFTVTELLSTDPESFDPVGWGPYILDEWVMGESMTLHKNPHYFRADEGLPNFDNLVIRIIGENTNASIAALLSGECDTLDQSTDLINEIEQVIELHDAGLIQATFTTGTVWEHIDFGIQHVDYDDGYQQSEDRVDFFSDVRTRQAFAMCMDRQALVDELMFGQSIVIDSYIPPQHPLYNSEVKHYEFDVQAGSALLEEIGWIDDDGDPETARIAQGIPNVPDGTPLEVVYETTLSVLRQNIQEIIQASLAQCGIVVDLRSSHPLDVFADGPDGPLFGRKFDLIQYAWATGVEPPCDLYLSNQVPGEVNDDWTSIMDGAMRKFGSAGWFHQNSIGFVNQEYDQACSTALGSLPGEEEFIAAHKEAQRIFSEKLPVVPLMLHIKLAASRPDMCGFIMDPTVFSELWNIEEFDYGEGCE